MSSVTAKPTALTFGSFHFAPDVSESQEVTQAEFFDSVRRSLGGIEGVSAVDIDIDNVLDESPVKLDPLAEDPGAAYVGPHWGFANINFDLTIPVSLQREIDKFARYENLSEHFCVQLAYGWQVPVSCVEVVSDSELDPTTGARVVYLYLKREVERSAERLTFACIPPIFTHAAFFLFPSDKSAGDQLFWRKSYTRPAYHRFEYYFNASELRSPARPFFFELQSEVDLYFRSKDNARGELNAWFAIQESVDDLTDPGNSQRRRFTPLRGIRRGARIRETAISLTRFAAQRQLARSQLERQAHSTYAGGTSHFARELIEDELDDYPDFPIEQFSQLVQMLESGRVVEVQIIVALVASLVGAAIGAGATLLAAG